MAPHHCSYCLKPIATKPGIKRHIAQSPACRDHWERLVERTQFAASNDKDVQLAEQTNDDVPDYPYEWEDALDGMDTSNDPLDVPDGHLGQDCLYSTEEDNGDLPHWPESGCFTEQYPGVATTILGKKKTIFKSLEAAELERGNGEWAPFHDEDEWELSQFLMKNLSQTKIDEYLKLSSVRKSGVSFKNVHSFLKHVDSLYSGPGWTCQMIDVEGDMEGEDGVLKQETLELW
ncbi:hypothetical protein SCLCIDRAFT_19625 [Scleroderma citrinum Foug A]|uniref:Uncharacterized protein n=1 Tax=Scleroderma citrinum Foug A TaxID=1036808 RepID=A0A0C3EPQ8_9AGAM|nr:hypothetical protein SCLCIDRAFT_19625 [Scleroderma citrinum Foug A]